jgi:hypothetical protein
VSNIRHHRSRITVAVLVRRLEHDVLRGADRAADLLLAPLTIDFRGWTMGDQRDETWM